MHYSKYFSPATPSSLRDGTDSTQSSVDSEASVKRGPTSEWDLSRRCEVLSSNPSLLPQPTRLVLQEIRRIYGNKSSQMTPNQTPSRNIYIKQEEETMQGTYTTPRRQLSFSALLSPQNSNRPVFLSPNQPADRGTPTPNTGSQQRGRIQQILDRSTATTPGNLTDKPSSESPLPHRMLNSKVPGTTQYTGQISTATSAGQQKAITNFFKGKKPLSGARDKSKSSNGSDAAVPHKSSLLDVDSMNPNERAVLEENLLTADEVACSLLYDDDSSQIRPAEKKKKRPHKERKCPEPCHICFALPWYHVTSTGRDDTEQTRKTSLVFVKMSLKPINQEVASWTRSLLVRVMESKSRKICYDAQALIKCLINVFGCDTDAVCLHWRCMDVKIAAWLLDPDHPPKAYSDVIQAAGLGATYQKEVDDTDGIISRDLSTLGPALVTLFHRLKSNDLWKLFWDLEMQLCPILAVMEMQGIEVDTQALLNASNVLKKKVQMVEAEAHKAAGHSFLINSPQQLREVLFDKLKLDQRCKKKLAKTNIKNCTSTSEAVLIQLQDLHPLPKLVLEYRQLVKLKSTYFDGILPFVKNGVLRTKWDHTAAATGRLTSTNPNLQNVPKQPIQVSGVKKQYIAGKEEELITIFPRDAYKSREGWSFLAADFQSIELRLLASLSDDADLLRIFKDETCTDVFTKLTSQWLDIPPENVQFAERERTKRIVYSVIYGVGRERLANTLGVGTDEAKGFMESFLGRFPGINGFSRKCIDDCQKRGFVSTIFQRKRWIPHIKSYEFQVRSQAERQAVNFVVQGSAADLCKSSMIQIVQAISKEPSLHARLLLQIHDELLLEVADADIVKVKDLVESIMTSSVVLCGERAVIKVPLPVTISTGKVWSQMRT